MDKIDRDLRFLGVGGAFHPVLGNTSAWFSLDGDFYLLDCGNTVFERVWYLPALKNSREIYIAITHLHYDHAASVAPMISACFYALGKVIHAIHPEPTINQLLALNGIFPNEYHFHTEMPAGLAASFEAVPVEHATDMNCYGYIIKTPDWCIYFGGDSKAIPGCVLERFRSGEIARIYQDVTINPKAKSHAGLSYLEQVIPPALRSRVFCVHIEDGAQEQITRAGFHIPHVSRGATHEL